jgi:ElaB/YqjD/DUF883 family membrane-anchored ribosome-binding protein
MATTTTTLDSGRLRREWKDIRDRARERWAQLTDDDLIIHGGNVEQFLNRLHKVTGEEIPAIEAYLAELLYGDSSPATRLAVEARERLEQEAARAARVVRRRPMGAVASAVCIGFVAGALVGLALRNR